MTRAMPVQRNIDIKEIKKEIVFLNDLVEKLNDRIDSLTKIKDKKEK